MNDLTTTPTREIEAELSRRRLASLSVEGQLGGRLSREWRPDGLQVIVDLPATALSRRRAAGGYTN